MSAGRKPGSYFACITFTLSLLVILVALVTLVIANPKLRVSMAVFTTAFSLGCVVIITRLFMRVLQAESLAARDLDANSAMTLKSCPDTHVLGQGDACKVDSSTTLTIAHTTDASYTKPIAHTCVSKPMSSELKTRWNVSDLKAECAKPSKDYLAHPYSALSPYCGSSP
jgi:hypothetical protein